MEDFKIEQIVSNPPEEFTFQIKKVTLTVGLLLTSFAVVLAIILDVLSLEINIEIKEYIAIATLGIITTTLWYHSKNVQLTHRYHDEKLKFDYQKLKFDVYKFNFENQKKADEKKLENQRIADEKKRKIIEHSHTICSEWNQPGLADFVHIARRFLNERVNRNTRDKFAEMLDADVHSKKAIVTVLNFFEHLSLLIKDGIVDEEVIKTAFLAPLTEYYSHTEPYIKERQIHSKRIWKNYQEIAIKWSTN